MAHELDFSNNRANMFSVKEVPWHGLGTIVETAPDIKTAIKLAGLDWEVDFRSISTIRQDLDTNEFLVDEVCDDLKAIYRLDTGKRLGYGGTKHTLFQNREAFNVFEPFVEDGSISLETAGSLFGGKRIWILGKSNVKPAVVVPKADDIVELYILLANSHDGTLSLCFGMTTTRVVCNNTLSFALGDKKSQLIKIRHTASIHENVKLVSETLNLANQRFEATVDQFKELARRDISMDDLKEYVTIVFDLNKNQGKTQFEEEIEEKESNKKNVLTKVVELFEAGAGNNLKGVEGTWWAGYNAVTDYLTHERGRTDENRFNSLYFGDSAKLNAKALELALEMSR